uniref:Uncharacterized protein n=1 Tax=Oryza glumipatula TaxID=40148 RepID=A0A0E0B7C6_9ORYZ
MAESWKDPPGEAAAGGRVREGWGTAWMRCGVDSGGGGRRREMRERGVHAHGAREAARCGRGKGEEGRGAWGRRSSEMR